MASPEVLDFERLLAPIPGSNPVGTDIRTDPSPVSDFQSIKGARTAARQAEKRIDERDPNDPASANLPLPDWKVGILERGKSVLANKAKDLEITAYVIEALVRLHGFAGLRDGYRLARELVERYWEGLYPDPDDTDYESRFSIILWLNGIDGPGTLLAPVRKLAMTGQGSEDYSYFDYQAALALAKLTDAKARQRRIDEGAPTLDVLQAAVAATPSSFYARLIEDLDGARREFLGFANALREKSGYDPPTGDLVSVIDAFEESLRDLARDKMPSKPLPTAEVEAVPDPAATPASGGGPAASSGAVVGDPTAIRNREDALAILGKVAEFFRRQEPQSILPYALEQVIAWGKMPLPELLTQLIPDDGSRRGLFKQVGIKSNDDE